MQAHALQWFGSGRDFLQAQCRAIASAQRCVRLESYILTDSAVGRRFRDALAAAAARGAEVQVLVDAFGSSGLADTFFAPLNAAGGEHKRFNQLRPGLWSLRDHRKVLLVDDAIAFAGGCNLSDEYDGDGIAAGWRDGGVAVRGPIVRALGDEFARQWQRADSRVWQIARERRLRAESVPGAAAALFLQPGLGTNPLRVALSRDLKHAREVAITSAYFLPSRRLRAQLARAARRGARVRLLLAGKSDVPLMSLASASLYRSLLRRGVEIYEYQPQVLHAKTLVLDDVVYAGSANLDPRSLRINFEVMLRLDAPQLAREARAQFERDLAHSRRILLSDTLAPRSLWLRLKQRFAFWLLARLDPWVAREHLRRTS